MSSLSTSFLGAFQGTVSVLLTLVAGYFAAKLKLLDSHTIHQLSKLCSHVFLPCLIITQMGPGITSSQLRLLWIIPVWGFISSILSHGIGFLGKSIFGFPNWVILAAGRANSSALPLLLLQSLEHVGILDSLKMGGESSADVLSRARGFVLLNTILQEILTFSIGKNILMYGREPKQTSPSPTPHGPSRRPSSNRHSETSGLLEDIDDAFDEDDEEYVSTVHRSSALSAYRIPRGLRSFLRTLTLATSWMNPVIVAGMVAVLFGMTPGLHKAFLREDGIFYPSITQPLYNVGQLFVVMQMFVVGATLKVSHTANPGLYPTAFSLLIRYIFMPVVGLAFVFFTARKGIYVDDPLLWFTLIMIPCGPSAMLLITIAENAGVDQGPIAGYLAVAYAFAPAVAVCCALALKLVDVIQAA